MKQENAKLTTQTGNSLMTSQWFPPWLQADKHIDPGYNLVKKNNTSHINYMLKQTNARNMSLNNAKLYKDSRV
jgi:hypothetical protein